MTSPPTGTVTFLFTDIEGSTQRWERQRAAMERALARHDALLRAAIEQLGGHVFKTVGDAFHAAFASATAAVVAAISAQRALQAEDWSAFGPDFAALKVRMALHTGTAELRDGDYFGPPLNRTARLMATGHGGQILLSLATQQLVRDALPAGAQLRDLGVHRLKDLRHSEHIFRLVVPDLPDVATAPDTAEELRPAERALFDAELLPTECPYRGLFAFREEDAAFFFGRETFTERLVEAITSSSMVAVIGPSGSGKSSVVFAGLLPQLRAVNGDGKPDQRWNVIAFRPGARPFEALAELLVPLLEGDMSATDRLIEIRKLATALAEGALDLASVMRDIRAKHPAPSTPLLVADQFEELYTLCREPDLRRRFLDVLFEATQGDAHDPPSKLALTLRADFMGHAAAYRPFADALQDHNVILGPMTQDELAQAITNPAAKQGRAFESGLAERIMSDVGHEPGNLPLLEFALTTLWERQSAGWLTHEAYEAIGRVEGALAGYADQVYQQLRPDEREVARRVFVQLVRPGEGTEDTRRLATRAELGDAAWSLVQKLADARLVVTNRAAAGSETAEVVHEALIRSWGQLREWMDADRTFRTWQERLRFALRQWEASDEDEGALLRGSPLAEADGWLNERGAELAGNEQRFIGAGLDLRDRRTRERQAQLEREAASARQLRQRAFLLAGTLALAAGLAVVAVVSRQQAIQDARIAVARELAAAAASNLEVDPERSALLALESISTTQLSDGTILPESGTVLHQAVSALHTEYALSHDDQLQDIDYNPDGSLVVTASRDGSARIWNVTTGQVLHQLEGHTDAVLKAIFSPNGHLVATVSRDKTARLWDTATGKLRHTLIGHDDALRGAAFSPDGQFIVTISQDKTARIWDLETGQELRRLVGHEDHVQLVEFSPSGRLIATASRDQTVRLWDASSGRQLRQYDEPKATASSLSFGPDSRFLAVTYGFGNPFAKVWNIEDDRAAARLFSHKERVGFAAFSPDGHLLATASDDTTAKVWEVASGRELHTLVGHARRLNSLTWSKDGNTIATASLDGTVRLWAAETGRPLIALRGHSAQVIKSQFSPDGLHVASIAEDSVARIWDVRPGREVASITGPAPAGYLALSPDGSHLAVLWSDAAVHYADLYDALTGGHLATLSGHSERLWQIDFSPDGQRIATDSLDHTAKVWDVDSGKELRTLSGHSDDLNGVVFSHDGTRVVTVSADKTARVWDALTGRELLNLSGYWAAVFNPRLSSDGTRLATKSNARKGFGTEIIVWDLDTGVRAFDFPQTPKLAMNDAEFSPDGKYLAVAGSDEKGYVRLWSAQTGALVHDLPVGPSESEFDISFSPDGRRLASKGKDGTVTIWDLQTARSLRRLEQPGAGSFVGWSPDGASVISTNSDGATTVWDVDSGEEQFTLHSVAAIGGRPLVSSDSKRLYYVGVDKNVHIDLLRLPDLVALARARLTRGFTEDECHQFLHFDTCPPTP